MGCKESEEVATGDVETATVSTQEVPGVGDPGDLSPMTAQSYIDDVTIGHEVGADGTIPAGRTGDDFAPGQPIHLAMKVADAPDGAQVKVMFYGANEAVVGEETKTVPAGAKTLTFAAPDTASWPKGDYRAEIWAGDEKVNTQQFQIVDPAAAGT
jgi:hypothetical protein